MKINFNPNIGFGYNYRLHKDIQDKLRNNKDNSKLASSLACIDSDCIMCENEVLRMEKAGLYRLPEYKDMTDFLVEIKSKIAFYIEYLLPDMNFAKKEFEEYAKEMNKVDEPEMINWRNELCNLMSTYFMPADKSASSSAGETKKENTKESKNNAELIKTTLREVAEQAVDNYKEANATNNLEKYVPSLSSPIGFESVAGMEDVKQQLTESIIQYVKDPELMSKDLKEYGIRPSRGFLFFGPPGCGKTYITKALAYETGLDMYSLDVSKVGSKYVNETSNNIRSAFHFLKEKTKHTGKPVILFMDEVDSFAMSRGDVMYSDENMKTVSTLLKFVEEARDNNIILIAATNKYNLLDEAFKARFDGQIYFPLPDKTQIAEILKKTLSSREKGKELAQSEENILKLADMLNGFSNRSIVFIVDEAAKFARRNQRHNISFEDVKLAIEKSDLEKSDERKYKQLNRKSAVGFKNN